MVVKGTLIKNIPFELKNTTKYPIGQYEWEEVVTIRKMIKGNDIYKAGSVFGQLEFESKSRRVTQVKALDNGKVYSIDWDSYAECKVVYEE